MTFLPELTQQVFPAVKMTIVCYLRGLFTVDFHLFLGFTGSVSLDFGGRGLSSVYIFLLLLLGYCQTIDLRIPGTRIMSWMYISNYFWNKKLLCRFLDMWYMLTIRKREKCVAWDWTLASPSYFTRYSLLISFWRWSYSVLSIFSSLWIINTIVKNMHHDHM